MWLNFSLEGDTCDKISLFKIVGFHLPKNEARIEDIWIPLLLWTAQRWKTSYDSLSNGCLDGPSVTSMYQKIVASSQALLEEVIVLMYLVFLSSKIGEVLMKSQIPCFSELECPLLQMTRLGWLGQGAPQGREGQNEGNHLGWFWLIMDQIYWVMLVGRTSRWWGTRATQ